MDILLTLNSYFVKYAIVMLHSLFANNHTGITVYILHEDLTEKDKNDIEIEAERFGNSIRFISVDGKKYNGFPVTKALPKECYYICMAHESLPQDMSRILYLDADTIVDGDISKLYNMAFEEKYLIACGQSFDRINGNYYRIGAQAERGELFNSGVMVFNLDKMRCGVKIEDFRRAAESSSYQWQLADQGLFNILFEDEVKIISSYSYNFRIGLLEEHVRNGKCVPDNPPVIYHFTMRDYYRIGKELKPWELLLSDGEERRFYDNGFQSRPYDINQVDEWRKKAFALWWEYAGQTEAYGKLRDEQESSKKNILGQFFSEKTKDIEKRRVENRKRNRSILMGISNNDFADGYARITYGELEKYIDELDADTAIQTLQNLFSHNCEKLKQDHKPIKVGFLVYSSAEWQCERIYRLMEEDDAFDPWIVMCAYGHGSPDSIRDSYIQACTFFRRAGNYQVEYLGYCDRFAVLKQLDRYQLLFYILPYTGLKPYYANLISRNINQLAIHIPYGIMIADRRDARYKEYLLDQPVMKMSWKYFCASKVELSLMETTSRLRGANAVLSGYPKVDDLIDGTFNKRNNIWKEKGNRKKRIIWAPHFNMTRRMNGTFHLNYKWFFDYARTHPETSWVVRPHPRMLIGVLESNVFDSKFEYEEYIRKWNELDNACVIDGGDYYDIFDTSDAMILDSLSFMAEYQYTGKPMLFLHQEQQRALNDLGEAIIAVSYTAQGDDYSAIECFLSSEIERDSMKEERETVFSEWMDNRKHTDVSASEYIVREIKRECADRMTAGSNQN